MFEVAIDYSFSAGHALREYKGKCENTHGHNYKVRVAVEGEDLDSTGLLVDFADLKRALRTVADCLDHQYLNDFPPFDKLNPSAENIARYFAEQLAPHINQRARLQSVSVWETDTSCATFRPGL